MNKRLYLVLLLILLKKAFVYSQAAVFWSEDFNNGCAANCNVSTFSSANGAWTVSQPGTNGNKANEWFVSCAENGESVGACGAGCGNNATLHVGSVPCTLCLVCPNGDCGATYNAGPTIFGENPTTDKRAESPLISTIGKSGITIAFKYIENGQGTTDDATVEYSIDGGTSWLLLVNPAKTLLCGNGQGTWTDYSYSLPATCDNIATLKIAFRWKNNANQGTDPSFAVDDVELLSLPANLPVAVFSVSDSVLCEKSCVDFSDLSTNTPTAWAWSLPGGQPDTSNAQNPSQVCYMNYGTYPVTLTVSNASGTGTTTYSSFITVHPEPAQPVITQSNDTLICSPAYAYQWYAGITLIPGATSQTYVPTQPGQYFCLISDSNDCSSGSNVIVITSLFHIDNFGSLNAFYNFVNDEVVLTFFRVQGSGKAEALITDITGRVLSETDLSINENTVNRISMKGFEKGIYILRINMGGEYRGLKFLK